ncbi:MAG: helix-turn-helix domain-containing protein [Candidatus Jorgensenbacteria bacterium]|nr:helix-turn-helix domain-containing protein [Candidatus Jorgensenbacteria bacterium]
MSGNRLWPRKGEYRASLPNSLDRRRIYRDKWKRNTERIPRAVLVRWYSERGKSMPEVADILQCSPHKVKYWLEKYEIPRRRYSEALYLKNNPDGDPFRFTPPQNMKEAELFGLGVGLYWGEGNKADKKSVRIGNTDPLLIKRFIEFLVVIFHIKKEDLKFSLQIFSDMSPAAAMDFWMKRLKIKRGQFYKTTVTRSGSIGTYRKKSRYGVLTVYYHNTRLRDLFSTLLPE